MVTHSMDNILNMQYYPANGHVDAAAHSPPMRKRRCLNKEVTFPPITDFPSILSSFFPISWKRRFSIIVYYTRRDGSWNCGVCQKRSRVESLEKFSLRAICQNCFEKYFRLNNGNNESREICKVTSNQYELVSFSSQCKLVVERFVYVATTTKLSSAPCDNVSYVVFISVSFSVPARSDVSQDYRETKEGSYEQLPGRFEQAHTGRVLEERSRKSGEDRDHRDGHSPHEASPRSSTRY